MTSHAEQHDRDKLARWRRDLDVGATGEFPVYAIFLVSPDDRAAHNIFRRFRASFDARDAGFQHLVIFGQHGVSSTVRGLLPELGLPGNSLPCLALLESWDPAVVYSLPLPEGESPAADAVEQRAAWQEVLSRIEAAADQGNALADLESIEGLARRCITAGPLVQILARLLAVL